MATNTITREQLVQEVTEHWPEIQRRLALAFRLMGVRDVEEYLSEASLQFWIDWTKTCEREPTWSVRLRMHYARKHAIWRTLEKLSNRKLLPRRQPDDYEAHYDNSGDVADYRQSVPVEDCVLESIISGLPTEYRRLARMLSEGASRQAIGDRIGYGTCYVQKLVNCLRAWLSDHPEVLDAAGVDDYWVECCSGQTSARPAKRYRGAT